MVPPKVSSVIHERLSSIVNELLKYENSGEEVSFEFETASVTFNFK